MAHTIEIRHNFESAHRLPHLPGKCVNLHGHSFWMTATIEAPTLDRGITVDYGQAKAYVRKWIDLEWDHGTILGGDDPLARVLTGLGLKVYTLPPGEWPTVEHLAHVLGGWVETFCHDLNRDRDRGNRPTLHVRRIHLQETHVNAATWTPEGVL